jgi:hypothetical protein
MVMQIQQQLQQYNQQGHATTPACLGQLSGSGGHHTAPPGMQHKLPEFTNMFRIAI